MFSAYLAPSVLSLPPSTLTWDHLPHLVGENSEEVFFNFPKMATLKVMVEATDSEV